MSTLESLAVNEARQVAALMARQTVVVQENENKLADLEAYLHSTLQSSAFDKGANGMMLMERQAFLARLRQAIEAQRQVVQSARSRLQQLRAQWIAKHLRGAALGKAVDRIKLQEAHQALRREQRAQDELAGRERQIW